ncbi:isoniazid response ATPase/transcriptional regulator IniR [Microbacterium awajiense]|uniref:Isoniazid response ATPase/transcriptional regulator IniR n=1 Tax=Microbacterium awajiense TaxID=415214 RepID=A0ABP7AIG6_9MICO
MTITEMAGAQTLPHDALGLWCRQALPVMTAIAAGDRATRAVVVGAAGSGKSSMLRELHRMLDDGPATDCVFGDEIDIDRVPPEHVLLVDDLHLLDPGRVEQIERRATDPRSSLVVASRPWVRMPRLTRISRTLERDRPAIVLGHLSRSDVLSYLDDVDQVISDRCVDDLLAATGGVTWLVAETLLLHDERDCAGERGHDALLRAVEDRVAHRLDTVPDDVRRRIEALAADDDAPCAASDDPVIARGYAEGLLTRQGALVPVVRSAARVPTRIARALVHRGDDLVAQHPDRAIDLYAQAGRHGMEPALLGGRRARAAWATGDLAAVGAIVDEQHAHDDPAEVDRLSDAAAALWSTRGMLATGATVYRCAEPRSCATQARATIAAIGSGGPVPTGEGPRPSTATLDVALDLAAGGLRSTVAASPAQAPLADLVRASQLYTAASSSEPVPELPAVIAVAAAMSIGDLPTAHTVVDDAVAGAQGGAWAMPRLLLWSAFLAVHRSRPAEARDALERATDLAPTLCVRDRLLAQAVRVAIAQRFEDSAVLTALWDDARGVLNLVEPDLFLLLPLGELFSAAARMRDTERTRILHAQAIDLVERLGSPPMWASPLHWSGIQQGILLNRPDELRPHARALVAASSRSPIAGVMAQAGRVWTAALAGSVDADAIDRAAHGLASAGLAWDGARLAGHGASRTSDRRASARLLACARDLHPIEGLRRHARNSDDADERPAAGDGSAAVSLSERETDVARLVLQGKTYAEIGGLIFISPRTVEHHVAHIKRRLGATSRSDLLAKLRVVVDEAHTVGRPDADASTGEPL